MPFAPLQLRGGLKVAGVDVSAQVMSFMFKGGADEVEIPATFGSAKSFVGGLTDYQVDINFLQDVDATALSQVFWDALGLPLTISGTLKTGVVSATNPQYAATMIVSAVGLGGKVNEIATDTVTFRLTGKPVKTIIP